MARAKNAKNGVGNRRGTTEADLFVGERIRALRNMQKISQDELGQALGVSFQQIQKYEKGTNRVSGSRLLQLGATLGCEASYFLEGAPLNGKHTKFVERDGSLTVSALDAVAKNSVGIRLIKAYIAMGSPKMRLALTEIAERLVGA